MADAGTWGALRPLVRVELRQLRRNLGRTALVMLLVAVPVAAMVGGSSVLLGTRKTLEEQRAQLMGQAQVIVRDNGRVGIDAALEQLPPHAAVEHIFSGTESVWVPGRKRMARFWCFEPAALGPRGLALGLLRLQGGRSPEAPDEVALSQSLLAGLGVAIGDEVSLVSGAATVTGEVVDPEDLSMPIVLRAADLERPRGAHALLIDLPPSEAAALAPGFEREGVNFALRERTGSVDGFEAVLIFLCGGFAFFEAALVIAAAFAVGVRRRQREIGLLGSTGAPIAAMRRSMAISAGIQALLGGGLGFAVGAGGARLLHPHLDGWVGRLNGGFELSLPHVIGALLLGLITAVAAAALPARGATRLPIRVALSGRRPVSGSSRAWLFGGIALAGLGAAILTGSAAAGGQAAGLGVLASSILVVLGLGCASPWVLGFLARAAGPLPLSWRLAVRDAGRFRARNGPVVTAVLAGMSVSVMLGALMASVYQLRGVFEPDLRDDVLFVEGAAAAEVAGRLGDELGGVAAAPLQAVYRRGQLVKASFLGTRISGDEMQRDTWIATGDDELLRVFGAEAGREAFAAGRLLSFLDEDAGGLDLSVGGDPMEAPAFAPVALDQAFQNPKAVLVSSELLALGLQAGPPPHETLTPWLVRLDAPVTRAVADRAKAITAEYAGSFVDAELLRFRPTDAFFNAITLLCIITGLIVVFVATTLSSVESAADARVLHTVGATPRLLRGHLAARAGYLALLGCVLAVPAGLMPIYGIQRLANIPLEFVMPWREIGITVLAMPVAAYVGTWVIAAIQGTGRRAVPTARFTA